MTAVNETGTRSLFRDIIGVPCDACCTGLLSLFLWHFTEACHPPYSGEALSAGKRGRELFVDENFDRVPPGGVTSSGPRGPEGMARGPAMRFVRTIGASHQLKGARSGLSRHGPPRGTLHRALDLWEPGSTVPGHQPSDGPRRADGRRPTEEIPQSCLSHPSERRSTRPSRRWGNLPWRRRADVPLHRLRGGTVHAVVPRSPRKRSQTAGGCALHLAPTVPLRVPPRYAVRRSASDPGRCPRRAASKRSARRVSRRAALRRTGRPARPSGKALPDQTAPER